MRLYLLRHDETLASALRPELERLAAERAHAFVAWTRPHPHDDFLEVEVPDEAMLRTALLSVMEHIRDTRRHLPPPPPA